MGIKTKNKKIIQCSILSTWKTKHKANMFSKNWHTRETSAENRQI